MAPTEFKNFPSQEELDRRKIVGINLETVTDVASTDFPGHWPGEDMSWSKKNFQKSFNVQFHHNTSYDSSFSLIGIDAAVANAFRRILIAEIPTLAIEYVFVNNNTSIIQDEVLAARLGLVPFKGGKAGLLKYLKWFKKPQEDGPEDEKFDHCYDYNTIVLHLNIECTRNEDAERGEKDPLKLYHNAHVYAKDIVFKPFGTQEKWFSGEDAIMPTNPDILIAKLRPGQCIDVEMHAIKGVGSDHAKYSPVATASYRLLPTITITKPILGKDAEKFKNCFPRGVIELEKVTKKESKMVGSGYDGHEGENKAVVKDAFNDTVSRECLRHAEFEGKVKLGRVRDHFIFSVESLGQWDSDEMFLEAVKTLKVKCAGLKKSLAGVQELA
ncbi:DNA-directed RNA polymerases I and III subunit RPAC1 [Hyphodiscus hymeniophilus]|uniref:DNA-directed RNA polymerases I and III subunit RPAC1 n=1 Tax=Hyphodiscus hymeniophilus TaxID=353542 RepID=A0A9P7AYP3_9HELO|nr:DNA-directed RNA polymerases I and III subunit RPAC1 [Hyphodiscus hymeniophilus]